MLCCVDDVYLCFRREGEDYDIKFNHFPCPPTIQNLLTDKIQKFNIDLGEIMIKKNKIV